MIVTGPGLRRPFGNSIAPSSARSKRTCGRTGAAGAEHATWQHWSRPQRSPSARYPRSAAFDYEGKQLVVSLAGVTIAAVTGLGSLHPLGRPLEGLSDWWNDIQNALAHLGPGHHRCAAREDGGSCARGCLQGRGLPIGGHSKRHRSGTRNVLRGVRQAVMDRIGDRRISRREHHGPSWLLRAFSTWKPAACSPG
jgi:hypothetical protein